MKKSQRIHEKGITIIALTVTIVVLIILAAISISTLMGDNGIIETTNEAKKKKEYSSVKDELDLIIHETSIDSMMLDGKVITLDILAEKLPAILKERDEKSKVSKINEEDSTLNVYFREYDFTIDGDLGTSGEFVGRDRTPPIVTFVGDGNKGYQNTNFYVTVKMEDDYSEIDTLNSKYIINKEDTLLGLNTREWDSGTSFENSEQEITINKDVGIYYIHVLAVDTSGNKIEYISEAIDIQAVVIASIRVSKLPKNQTIEVLPADVTGMEIEVTYNSGKKEIVTSGYKVYDDNRTIGKRDVTVEYGGCFTTIQYEWVTKQPTSIQLIGSPINKYVRTEIGPNWNGATLKVTYNNGTTASFSPESCWSNKWSTSNDIYGRYRSPNSDGNYSFQFSHTHGGKTVSTSYSYKVGPLTGKAIRNTNELFDMDVSLPTGDVFKTGKTMTVYKQSDEEGSYYWLGSNGYRYVVSADVQLVK